MKEIWKPCKNYSEQYEVSSFGRIRNKKNGNIKAVSDHHGYKTTTLCKETRYVHRLVAEVFVPNPNNRPEVNHINGNKADNRAENLEWCTKKINIQHAKRMLHRTFGAHRHVLCVETKEVFESTKDFERKTGCSAAAVRRVLCGDAKTSCGLHWEYTDSPTTNINSANYKNKSGWQVKLAKEIGISDSLLRWRLKNGWSWEDIRNVPANLANRYRNKTKVRL